MTLTATDPAAATAPPNALRTPASTAAAAMRRALLAAARAGPVPPGVGHSSVVYPAVGRRPGVEPPAAPSGVHAGPPTTADAKVRVSVSAQAEPPPHTPQSSGVASGSPPAASPGSSPHQPGGAGPVRGDPARGRQHRPDADCREMRRGGVGWGGTVKCECSDSRHGATQLHSLFPPPCSTLPPHSPPSRGRNTAPTRPPHPRAARRRCS